MNGDQKPGAERDQSQGKTDRKSENEMRSEPKWKQQ